MSRPDYFCKLFWNAQIEKGRRQLWYDFHTLSRVDTASAAVTVPAPLEKIPVFLRGGKIIPRKMRLRRSSKLMFYDPYTLIIAYDGEMNAEVRVVCFTVPIQEFIFSEHFHSLNSPPGHAVHGRRVLDGA